MLELTADRADEVAARAAQLRRDAAAVDRARRSQEEQRLAGQRAKQREALDSALLRWAVGLSVTVLVPWAVGAWLFRGGRAFPALVADLPSDTLMQLRLNTLGSYFLGDWAAGVATLLALAALGVLLGSWRQRTGRVSVAIAFVVVSGVLVPGVAPAWATGDSAVVAMATTTAYPFDDYWATCGDHEISATVAGQRRLVQFWTSEEKGTSACNRVETWSGWRRLAVYTLPNHGSLTGGDALTGLNFRGSNSTVFGGAGTAATGFVTVTSDGYLTGTDLSNLSHWWRVKLHPSVDPEVTFGERFALVRSTLGDHSSGELRSLATGRLIRRVCAGKFQSGSYFASSHSFAWRCGTGIDGVQQELKESDL